MNYNNSNIFMYQLDQMLCRMFNELMIVKNSSNITVEFINNMKIHHNEVISICKNFLNYSNYRPLVENTQRIIKYNEKEIEYMNMILNTTPFYISKKREMQNYLKKNYRLTEYMFNNVFNSIKTNNIDLNFIFVLIKLFDGTIKICKNVLKHIIDPRLKELVNNMIINYVEEIKILNKIEKNIISFE